MVWGMLLAGPFQATTIAVVLLSVPRCDRISYQQAGSKGSLGFPL
jgi:hypothetical protein